MQNKTNPSIFYAAALLKKRYDTINPCCQQSTDGDSQHPGGHQTLRNSPAYGRKPLRGPYPDNGSRNGVCRTHRNLQILRQIECKRTGSFRNHPFQRRHLRNFGSHGLHNLPPTDMVPSEMAVKQENATQSGRSSILFIPIPNPSECPAIMAAAMIPITFCESFRPCPMLNKAEDTSCSS